MTLLITAVILLHQARPPLLPLVLELPFPQAVLLRWTPPEIPSTNLPRHTYEPQMPNILAMEIIRSSNLVHRHRTGVTM